VKGTGDLSVADGVAVLGFAGEHDVLTERDNLMRLRLALLDARALVIDVTALEFGDTALVSLFTNAHRAAGRRRIPLVIALGASDFMRVLEVSNVLTLFRIRSTRAEAVALATGLANAA
jgi:anti-anti-sigma regulatory factor